MKSVRRVIVLCSVLSSVYGPILLAGEQGEAPEAPASVEMVEIALSSRVLTGRLVMETEAMIHVEPPAQATVAYPKDTIRDLKRFSIPLYEYHEQVGDAYNDRIWEVEDGPAMVVKARRAYEKALQQVTGQEARDRIEAKLEALAEERDEWHREALRKEEVKKAEQEAEKARIERDLAEEELASVRRHERLIQELRDIVEKLDDRLDRLEDKVEYLDEKVEDLEDDIDRLEDRHRLYITSRVFLDLRNAHSHLADRVGRLESQLPAE